MSDIAPSVDNYMIGKGKCYFDRNDSDGNSTGELDLGNDPSFSLGLENENLDHYSSMDGVKKKDKSAVISTDQTIAFTLDEINIENLNLALFGDGVEYLNLSDGIETDKAAIAKVDRWVKLAHRKLNSGTVVITNAAGTVTYTEVTDYTLDLVRGRFYTVSTGGISNNENVLVDYKHSDASYPIVNSATNVVSEGLLRFVGNNDYGSSYEVELWKVKLSVNGEIPLITEDWSQIEFTAEVLDDSENHPESPYGRIIDLDGDLAVES